MPSSSGSIPQAMVHPMANDEDFELWLGRSSKTAILTDALTAWFDRRAGHELDQRFGTRLDRQNRTAERIEQKIDTVAEALGTFVQHQLTLVAHQPPFDRETARLGLSRYEAFVDLVRRRRAGNARAPGLLTERPNEEGQQ